MSKPQQRLQQQAGISRRSFLVATAAVGTGLAVGTHVKLPNARASTLALQWDPQAFIHIGADSSVTVVSKHTEMGQGIYTGLATIVAEELDAAWEQMQVESAPVNTEVYKHIDWGDQATGGSSSIENSFAQLRQVGATTRAMLLNAAAQKWGVTATDLTINDGVIRHAGSGKSSRFGELAELVAAGAIPETVQLKPIDNYRFSKRKIRRVDVEAKTNGQAVFTQDFSLPGMKIAVVAHAPRFGGVVATYDATQAKSVAGVTQVVEIPTGIAVIASSFWAANQARDLLRIEWDESNAFMKSSDEIMESFKEIANTEGTVVREAGSIASAVAASTTSIEAEFEYPMLAHATMEPLNCVVQWSGDKCRIWGGTQQQSVDQRDAAEILGIPLEDVEICTLLAGGGFGRRSCKDYASEAVQVAKALGPSGIAVKLMWTREDDMQAGMYRPLNYHRVRADIDSQGKITSWQHKLVGQSIAAQAMPSWIENGIDNMSVQGANDWPYDIPNIRIESHSPDLPIPVLWYRGVGATHTVFTVETFIDEIAEHLGRDPVAFRLGMLGEQPRMAALVRLLAQQADWDTPLAAGRGRGIAICAQRRSLLAQAAEISVRDDGSFSVDRVVTALDCGVVLNPDVVRAQIEGGVGFGLSSALYDAITMRDGYVEQSNFDTYSLLRMQQMPEIEAHIMPSTDAPSGVGELATMGVSAAVANALHAVTGKRYYSLPIRHA